jgi:1,4-alpha-glucan branching enzyme
MEVLSPIEKYLFHEGNYFRCFETFGAHINNNGTRFCVWAPHAKEVAVVGDFNEWNGIKHKMVKVNNEGIWELEISDISINSLYKYEITTHDEQKFFKSDPYAFYSELRPNTASIVVDIDNYEWNDSKWINDRLFNGNYEKLPLSIYELHIGSWKRNKDGSFLTYKELANELVPYLKKYRFTHVELLPVSEHPLDLSWGYQTIGYYSITSRYGTPEDFMFFVDALHQNGIGVILDWVPGHFCKDSHGLYMFDGYPTYEYKTSDVRENVIWGTSNFDLSKGEVQSFLISNLIFWIEKYHIDGFRIDAVANIIYWNNNGRNEANPFGVEFLKKLNHTVKNIHPDILIIAEDSTDWEGVTDTIESGGLGFDYKWNMGWMNDVLQYVEADFSQKESLHNNLTFPMLYNHTEKFILPLSHDEVVHGKKSLLNKMPGDYWDKFAQFRLLMAFMITHPGKKLIFMGSEIGQFDEWNNEKELDWFLEEYPLHAALADFNEDVWNLYYKTKAFWELDYENEGFQWIDCHNHGQRIYSYIRSGKKPNSNYVVVLNFSPVTYHDYKVGVTNMGEYKEIINTDKKKYGGSGQINHKKVKTRNEPFHGKDYSIDITLPPYGATILKLVRKRKGT